VNNPDSLPAASRNSPIWWLMLVILVWGLLLALGTYLFGGNKPLFRALIVAGCTLAFLGFWAVALAMQKKS
jgi:hypothetical protein